MQKNFDRAEAEVRHDGATRRRPDAGVQQHRAGYARPTIASRPRTCVRSASVPRGAASASATKRSPGAGRSTSSVMRGRSCRPPIIRPSALSSTRSIPSRSGMTTRRSPKIPGDRIFFAQLADAPLMRLDPLSWSRHFRLFPGQGAFPVTRFTRNVLASGYNGPISLEIFNDEFRSAPPRPTAIDAMRSLLLLEEELAARFGGATRARCSARAGVPRFRVHRVRGRCRDASASYPDVRRDGVCACRHTSLQGCDPAPPGRRESDPQRREGRICTLLLPAPRPFGVRARIPRRRCPQRDRTRAPLQGADISRQGRPERVGDPGDPRA